jgi:3-dehydroquinate synthase II
MKELWLEIEVSVPETQKTKLLTAAAKTCDAVLIDAEDLEKAKKVGIKTASTSETTDITVLSAFDPEKIKMLKAKGTAVAVKITIMGKEDEETAIKAAELNSDYVIVGTPDWKIIPLENLIAKTRGKTKLLAEVSSTKEAKVALETLELGSDGVVLKTASPQELEQTAEFAKKASLALELVAVAVTGVKEIGTGARACIDTCELMKPGEGILLGCQSSGLFLVQAEVHESPPLQSERWTPFAVRSHFSRQN